MKKSSIFSLLIGLLIGMFTMFLLMTPEKDEISLNKAINKINNATVLIETYNGNVLKNTGTGFFYKKDNKYGYILTNEHVVSDGVDIEIVTTKDERVKAEVLGKNEYLDLAVLRINKKYVQQVATIGNSRDIKLGDPIFTIGSPLGYDYRSTVTSGIISGKNRLVEVDTKDEELIMKLIQINASINPGNSGGPILNINGEVIGICTLKLDDKDIEGIGFAIPIEYAMNYIEYLENNKEIKYPELPFQIADSNDTSTLLKNNIDINQDNEGIIVLENKLGLKKGDLIIKINNNQVKDISTLKCELLECKSKDRVVVTYLRNGKEKKTKITLS